MITVKQVTITDITARTDGTIDFNIAGESIALPVNIKKVKAVGLNPYFEKVIRGSIINEAVNSNDNYLGSLSVIEADGTIISEFIFEGCYYQNIKIKQLLRPVDTAIKGGDIIKVIPQFSKEIIQKFSSKVPVPFQVNMYDKTKIYIDVYIQYE